MKAEPSHDLLHRELTKVQPGAALTETQYLGFNIPEHGVHGLAYIWYHPNLKVVTGGVYAWTGIREHNFECEIFDFVTYMDDTCLEKDLPAMVQSSGQHLEQAMRTTGTITPRGCEYNLHGTRPLVGRPATRGAYRPHAAEPDDRYPRRELRLRLHGVLRPFGTSVHKAVRLRTMYDPIATLRMIDQHAVAVIALCAVALVFNYAYFIEAIRLGFRHRSYSVPAPVTLVFLPHDVSYLLQYPKWFGTYDHWFCKLWFCGLVATASIECIFYWQLVRYGRKDLLPQVGEGAWRVIMALGLLVGAGAWLTVKQALNDDLYLFSFGWTLFWGAPLCLAMIARRGNSRGQSRWMWISYSLMAVFYWAAVSLVDPYFRSPSWLAILAMAVGCAVANLWMLGRVPAYTVREAAAAP